MIGGAFLGLPTGGKAGRVHRPTTAIMIGRAFLDLATAAVLAFGLAGPAAALDRFIVVQSTTSIRNSGLFDHILPTFTGKTGIEVRVVAVGTGQAIRNAANGDGDVLFVHARAAEEKFVADGDGVARFDVMYNDFVIVGPPSDPAGIAGMAGAVAALAKIAAAEALFASRGDDSGTHKAELGLWKEAGVDVEAASGGWYRETGSGMGATLNIGTGMGAYVMTDRATWIAFGNKGGHRIVVEGDPRLFNQYGIILVNPDRHPGVKADLGRQFVDWILSGEGQAAIASYKVDGRQLFFPNAGRRGPHEGVRSGPVRTAGRAARALHPAGRGAFGRGGRPAAAPSAPPGHRPAHAAPALSSVHGVDVRVEGLGDGGERPMCRRSRVRATASEPFRSRTGHSRPWRRPCAGVHRRARRPAASAPDR